jgi:hypothetical protein
VVARRGRRHKCWTAYDANLSDASDEILIIYAQDKQATLVTTNRNCALMARKLRLASVIWLQVREQDAAEAMGRALEWLTENELPQGMVLVIKRRAAPVVLSPLK